MASFASTATASAASATTTSTTASASAGARLLNLLRTGVSPLIQWDFWKLQLGKALCDGRLKDAAGETRVGWKFGKTQSGNARAMEVWKM